MMKTELSWVDALLSRWGRWAIRCESGALGFAASCSLGGGDTHENTDGYYSAEPRGLVDEDMEAVDGAVRKLPDVLRIVVIRVYIWGHGKSDRMNADALGIDRKTIGKYLIDAHSKIALDISIKCPQNHAQSVNGGTAPKTIKPVPAHA